MASSSAIVPSDAAAPVAYRSYKQRFTILGLYALSNSTNAFLVGFSPQDAAKPSSNSACCTNRRTRPRDSRVLGALSSLQWICFAPIVSATKQRFDVGDLAVNMLSLVYMVR